MIYFPRKFTLTFHANYILRRQFAWNVKAYFLEKIRKKSKNNNNASKCRLLKCLPSMLSVKEDWLLDHYSGITFLVINKNICCMCSLESPCWDDSDEYTQHMLFFLYIYIYGEIRKQITDSSYVSLGVVGWCEGVMYLMSPGRPADIGLQLGKACYPCSG